jgi:hypothetical protein
MKKIFFLSILISFLSCKKEEEKIEPKYEYVNNEIYESQSPEIDFYNFKHQIDSDYSFDIKITNIKVIEHKNIFEVKKDKYAKPDKISGTSVTIEFDIKNPYDRIIRIPFPYYYEIGTENYEELGSGFVGIKEGFYMTNQCIVENGKGVSLSSFSSEEVIENSKETIVEFEPNESKSIVVKFTKPFPSTIKQALFVGFNKYKKKYIEDLSNMSEEEKKIYFEDKSLNYGLVIDLESKKITNLVGLPIR